MDAIFNAEVGPAYVQLGLGFADPQDERHGPEWEVSTQREGTTGTEEDGADS